MKVKMFEICQFNLIILICKGYINAKKKKNDFSFLHMTKFCAQ